MSISLARILGLSTSLLITWILISNSSIFRSHRVITESTWVLTPSFLIQWLSCSKPPASAHEVSPSMSQVPFSSEEKGSSPSASLGGVILPKRLSPGFSPMTQPSRIHLMLFIFCLLLGLFSFQIIGPNSNLFEHKEGLISSHDPGRAEAEPGETPSSGSLPLISASSLWWLHWLIL